MPRRVERIPLMTATPGTSRHLTVHRYGKPGARPKAYLQAGLHADELPGMLVLHHLLQMLDTAEARNDLLGEIVIVPCANPIGLTQHVAGMHLGRYELGATNNFNRGYPDLTDDAAARIEGKLGDDPATNTATIREVLLATLGERQANSELEDMRIKLMALALDADVALDLHCDLEALCYFFTGSDLWPEAKDLAAEIGARAVLLAVQSGGDPFDESLSAPWALLAERFAGHPIPKACLSATLELRGTADVDDVLARADAEAIFRFLTRRCLISGDPGPLPPLLCDATPLDAADSIPAPVGGVIAFLKKPGDSVEAGEAVAHIVDPTHDDPAAARTPVVSRASGLMYARARDRLVRPGQTVANVAGSEPLPHRTGFLMEP